MQPSSGSPRYRVLCLHGIGTNSELVAYLSTANLRYLLTDEYDFEFIDGAYECSATRGIAEVFGTDQIYFSYYDGSAESVLKAVRDLAEYVVDHGPFDAVMGFSLGAALAMTLLLNHIHVGLPTVPFKCAIFLCGTLPCDWASLKGGQVRLSSASANAPLVHIPTVHFWSPDDVDYPRQSQMLLGMCDPATRVEVTHHAGHAMPTHGKEVGKLASTPSPLPDHISHNYVIFLGIGSMMTFLSTLLVTARFLSRWFTWSVKWDDWACLGALIFAYGFLTTTALVATVGRAGYHLDQYNYSVLERYLQIALANNVLYNVSISLTKLSILLFYRRIFAISKGFRIAIWVVGGVVAGYFVSAVCGLIFAASPVEAQWKVWLPHTTINNKPFWVSMGIINALLDFTLLCLPQPLVWRLHQTQRRKILLSMVFLLGCL
ncbi:hypothetical protein BDV26DRAFT_283842 [Aspergillus bertholletiae]|uniref:Uncharacterized protein n=1 Tax=Aspergillus bertholletiae TaxID=1226010 RepID=A0A5N7AYL2_9EURO|nr:hypothetical protein BDV26DRAFT_283842 [Aspergillus bertholletiae]